MRTCIPSTSRLHPDSAPLVGAARGSAQRQKPCILVVQLYSYVQQLAVQQPSYYSSRVQLRTASCTQLAVQLAAVRSCTAVLL